MLYLSRSFRIGLVLAILIGTVATAAEKKIPAAKQRLIKELLEVTEANEGTADAIVDILGGRLGVPLPTEEMRGETREDPSNAQVAEKTLVPIYDRYFTQRQLRDLIAFFKTETGRHYVEVARKIAAESRENIRAETIRRMNSAEEEKKAERTRNAMRALGIALQAYRAEHDTYPAATGVDQLAGIIGAHGSDRDGWGRPLHYEVSLDRRSYRLVSGGADGVVGGSDPSSDDIIYRDGHFIHGGDPHYKQ
jgi:uncharacterized protein